MPDEMRPDIAAAWERVADKMGRKRDIRKLPEYLNAGETVLLMAGGRTGGNNGLLVATNRRALFVAEGLINHSHEDFPYDRITSVTTNRGMLLAKIVVHTGGAARIIENIAKSEAEAVSAIIRERVEAVTRERSQPVQPAPAAVVSATGIAAELRELAELRDLGVLTSDEFETQKQKLLNR
nr:PH domain-containing protein [Rhodococcus sp. (in: high G+C Gram-positive bacteria)]